MKNKHIKRFNESDENLNMSDSSNSISGLVFGIDGEIIQITKYKKNWHKMFDEHKIDNKYKTRENFEQFCYLNYMGLDAEAVFVEKVKELETK